MAMRRSAAAEAAFVVVAAQAVVGVAAVVEMPRTAEALVVRVACCCA